ncbi:CREM isoform 21 [Pan troglodytes]|uniref:cAMP responsive element modulator n=5 Tax=Hominidae TaxID=9604 RepID=F8WB03_HUMAN|nr:cAMP responsive element modulator [Homo sapiens]KAI4075691.1 cAMP responsive element modulator [Homo sapiens]PNI60881.1 CREM isoform 21 [Pan troglodytes]PNJ39679.1 CREM isoform 21 [Pongo abelii]
MTMETVESQHDGSITASLTESKSAHVQTQTGQNSIPALAQLPLVTCQLTRSELLLLLCHREW